MLMTAAALERDIVSVAQLNQMVRELLEVSFPLIWVEGEISNLSRPASGHLYFSLKDARAQVRCALFRNRLARLGETLANGQKVLVQAQISLYEPRGDFQLIVEYLEAAGEGALRRAYDELRLRLEREGLFAAQRKQAPPTFPQRIGVITSPSGAAIRDVLNILRRRLPSLPVLVYPVAVQGEGAAEQIARTIRLADERRECDVLLLVRGGGSLEDLWAFNEEAVARAICACTLPVITGVGHETDVTIADFAADLRAPTPSAAAELASPDRLEWLRKFTALSEHLEQALKRRLQGARQSLHGKEQYLHRLHPGRRLRDQGQRLDDLEQRLRQALTVRLERVDSRFRALASRLHREAPRALLETLQGREQSLRARLIAAAQQHLARHHQRLVAAGRTLHALSPLQTLGRGYAILRRYPSGELLRQAGQAQVGEELEAWLAEGRLICEIKRIQP
jgi:exodeoxyribonuclease VII large subunit